jgi:hypothetical protein
MPELEIAFPLVRNSREYTILAALRGPDSTDDDHSEAKEILTARIRGIVMSCDHCPGNWEDTPLSSEELASLLKLVPGLNPHYLFHAYCALMCTIKHPVWGGHGEALATAMKTRLGYLRLV